MDIEDKKYLENLVRFHVSRAVTTLVVWMIFLVCVLVYLFVEFVLSPLLPLLVILDSPTLSRVLEYLSSIPL